MSDLSCDVAVVGGGIVGAATALALRRAGFDTRLIESGPRLAPFAGGDYDPRVYAITPGSARFLDALEVWPEVLSARSQAIQQMQVWQRTPAGALCFDAAESGSAALGWIVEHRLLADALWSRIDPARTLTGTMVSRACFDDEAVRLTLHDGRSLRAQLVIGAEGAASPLRQAAGIGSGGWSYDATALVCHLECGSPHHGVALQRFLPTGPVALLPLADGRRSLVWSTRSDDARALQALGEAAFARMLESEMQGACGRIGAITPRLNFQLRMMHAERYIAPRLALVGDSAHVIHPLAGQGLNLGLADVQCLVAELASARSARRAWAADRTLARYERARLDANLEMVVLTDGLHRAFGGDLAALRTLVSRGLEWVGRVPALRRGLTRRAGA